MCRYVFPYHALYIKHLWTVVLIYVRALYLIPFTNILVNLQEYMYHRSNPYSYYGAFEEEEGPAKFVPFKHLPFQVPQCYQIGKNGAFNGQAVHLSNKWWEVKGVKLWTL